ncbi:MAG: gamma-glutamyl kinase [Planktomarina sp.]
MLVFWQKKLVLFSVPKTGTSAIDQVLAPHADMAITGPPIMKHLPVYRYNRFIQPLWDAVEAEGFETFAMIREPIDWLGSWYRFRARPDLDGTENSTMNVTFDEFVDAAIKGKPPSFAHVGSQERFLSGGVGRDGVDHLFQYEQMPLALDFLQDRLGIDMALSQINVSPPMQLHLSDKITAKFQRKRSQEIALWQSALRHK